MEASDSNPKIGQTETSVFQEMEPSCEFSYNTGNNILPIEHTPSYVGSDYSYLKIYGIVHTISSSQRGAFFYKIQKSDSTIRLLSTLNTRLCLDRISRFYLQHHFLKSSFRYFIYTLEQILI